MFYAGGFQSSNHLYHKRFTEIPSMSTVTQRFCLILYGLGYLKAP